jgi:hypothetical protein
MRLSLIILITKILMIRRVVPRTQTGVWLESSKNWDGATVTVLWSVMCTKTTKQVANPNNSDHVVESVSYRKSRNGQIAVRTVYNKLGKAGMFEGNKQRKREQP